MNNDIDTTSDLRDLIVADIREVQDDFYDNYLFNALDDERFEVPSVRDLH